MTTKKRRPAPPKPPRFWCGAWMAGRGYIRGAWQDAESDHLHTAVLQWQAESVDEGQPGSDFLQVDADAVVSRHDSTLQVVATCPMAARVAIAKHFDIGIFQVGARTVK